MPPIIQTIDIVKTRAKPLGIQVIVGEQRLLTGHRRQPVRLEVVEVRLELRTDQLVVDVLDRAGLRVAGVVDDRPRTAVGHLGELFDALLARVGVVDVHLDRANADAAVGGGGLHELGLGGAADRAHDVVAGAGELEHGHQADPAVGTCDEN